jgi:ribosomal protein S4E
MKKKQKVLVVSGNHVGKKGIIIDVDKHECYYQPEEILYIKTSKGEEFSVYADQVEMAK